MADVDGLCSAPPAGTAMDELRRRVLYRAHPHALHGTPLPSPAVADSGGRSPQEQPTDDGASIDGMVVAALRTALFPGRPLAISVQRPANPAVAPDADCDPHRLFHTLQMLRRKKRTAGGAGSGGGGGGVGGGAGTAVGAPPGGVGGVVSAAAVAGGGDFGRPHGAGGGSGGSGVGASDAGASGSGGSGGSHGPSQAPQGTSGSDDFSDFRPSAVEPSPPRPNAGRVSQSARPGSPRPPQSREACRPPSAVFRDARSAAPSMAVSRDGRPCTRQKHPRRSLDLFPEQRRRSDTHFPKPAPTRRNSAQPSVVSVAPGCVAAACGAGGCAALGATGPSSSGGRSTAAGRGSGVDFACLFFDSGDELDKSNEFPPSKPHANIPLIETDWFTTESWEELPTTEQSRAGGDGRDEDEDYAESLYELLVKQRGCTRK